MMAFNFTAYAVKNLFLLFGGSAAKKKENRLFSGAASPRNPRVVPAAPGVRQANSLRQKQGEFP